MPVTGAPKERKNARRRRRRSGGVTVGGTVPVRSVAWLAGEPTERVVRTAEVRLTAAAGWCVADGRARRGRAGRRRGRRRSRGRLGETGWRRRRRLSEAIDAGAGAFDQAALSERAQDMRERGAMDAAALGGELPVERGRRQGGMALPQEIEDAGSDRRSTGWARGWSSRGGRSRGRGRDRGAEERLSPFERCQGLLELCEGAAGLLDQWAERRYRHERTDSRLCRASQAQPCWEY